MKEEIRTSAQNRKGWPMWTDLSKQLIWYGHKLTKEHWKEMITNEWKAQLIVPGISGGFCALGCSSKTMKKLEFSEIIELTYAFGTEKGVQWSEPALKAYEQYREANAA